MNLKIIMERIFELGKDEMEIYTDKFNNIIFKLVNREIESVFIIPKKFAKNLKGDLCNHNIIKLLYKYNLNPDDKFFNKTIKNNSGHGVIYSNAPHECIKTINHYYLNTCLGACKVRSINKLETLKNMLSLFLSNTNILNTIFKGYKSSKNISYIWENHYRFMLIRRTIGWISFWLIPKT